MKNIIDFVFCRYWLASVEMKGLGYRKSIWFSGNRLAKAREIEKSAAILTIYRLGRIEWHFGKK